MALLSGLKWSLFFQCHGYWENEFCTWQRSFANISSQCGVFLVVLQAPFIWLSVPLSERTKSNGYLYPHYKDTRLTWMNSVESPKREQKSVAINGECTTSMKLHQGNRSSPSWIAFWKVLLCSMKEETWPPLTHLTSDPGHAACIFSTEWSGTYPSSWCATTKFNDSAHAIMSVPRVRKIRKSKVVVM